MSQKSLNDCAEPNPSNKQNLDPSIGRCETDIRFQTCEGDTSGVFFNTTFSDALDGDTTFKKTGLGHAIDCDPMVSGKIVNDPSDLPMAPDKAVVYRVSQGIRGTDEAVKQLFQNLKVIDDAGKVKNIPTVWGTQEKAVAVATQANVRKDNTGVTDRITLPIISVYSAGINFTKERYMYHMAVDYKRGQKLYDVHGNLIGSPAGLPGWTTQEKNHPRDTIFGTTRGVPIDCTYTVTLWTYYLTDMNQILTQIAMKFSPQAYIRIQGVTNWETIVKIDSVTNNLNTEVGEDKRVIKYQLNLTAETFIPQPIVRRKAVLKTRVEIVDGISDSDIQSVLGRIESAIGEIDI